MKLRQIWASLSGRAPLSEPAPAPEPAPRPAVIHPGSDGRPFPLLADLIAAFSREARPEVLVFGDSVMERVSRHDDDKRTLGAMISAAVPERTCHIASRTALNPSLMRALLRVVRRLGPPRVVVLPVNLRAFSPQWDLSPAWALHQELGIIEAWLSNPGLPIPPLWDLRNADDFYAAFDRTPVAYPLSALASIGDFRALIASKPDGEAGKEQRKREIFVLHYTHPLVAGHRKLVDLATAAELTRRIGAEPLLYVTPINVEVGRALVGPAFPEALAANVACMRSALARHAELHDLSSMLPAVDFFAEDLATEHLNEVGRSKVARRVAEEVLSRLPAGSAPA